MPIPSGVSSIPRPDLFDTFMEFDAFMAQEGMIGAQVLPFFDVSAKRGEFKKIKIEQILKGVDLETLRAPKGHYNSTDLEVDKDTWDCEEHGWEERIDDAEEKIYGSYFDVEAVCAARARRIILEAYERRVAAAVMSTSVWTGSALQTDVAAGAAEPWTVPASATPIDDVINAHDKVRKTCGKKPNTVIMSAKTFENLQLVDQILDQIKYAGFDDPKKVTLNALAALFQVEQILVGGMVKKSSVSGESATLIWPSDKVMVCHIERGADLRSPGIGRTFHWAEDSVQGGAVETYRDETRRSDIVRVRQTTDEKVIYPGAGHLLINTSA